MLDLNSKNMSQYINFVSPSVYFIGETSINFNEIERYLSDTDQLDFLETISEARKEGLSDGEILCSFYAKLCYASLTLGKNQNISKVRDIYSNILGTIESGHGSVFEHCQLNFTITNCSRIYTHEQVRHRVGTAYSQTSGRYVRTDKLNLIIDPILEPIFPLVEEARVFLEDWYKRAVNEIKLDEVKDFATKKKITSALRRLMPNGQSNEIGYSVNLRTLRHTIELRTSRHAEWEIRDIYNQIFNLVLNKYPAMFKDAQFECVDGMNEITFHNKKI